MTLEELYAALGGSYETVIGRLPSEALVRQLLTMFLQDENYEKMIAALADGDRDAAFRAAHTLKGVSGDLGLTDLYQAMISITDTLRHENNGDPNDFLPLVKDKYQLAVDCIKQL